ncbi:NACHT domain-containing protein [Parasphingorhabdus sp.]|jgi:hypothetical protein|uniref:NACHT domain-containing protein n=1 Tax=Parasphingorhabdus sp. TaxID=2709688 RepID=UPI0039E3EB28
MVKTNSKSKPVIPGDELRDHAAELLQASYGRILTEFRADGKKADIYFEQNSFGKKTRNYVEAKDYTRNLTRKEVVAIWTDYSGIVEKNKPAILILVTRNGLSADAQAFVESEQALMRHQTILEVENSTLGLSEYNGALEEEFDQGGLSKYYIEANAYKVSYDEGRSRFVSKERVNLYKSIREWVDSTTDSNPIAILGGYGAGKSSFAQRLVSEQAGLAAEDPAARKPILIKLGSLTRFSSIEGLLGGMFTSEFPLPSFNFRSFMTLNRRGRLLVILDGFDEMKHAMSWSEFRNQIKDLSRFVSGNSKVLLLGRPTAFLSFEEHIHVLRGVKRVGNGWRKELDWPEFQEFELASFDEDEREAFVRAYLGMRLNAQSTSEQQRSDRILEALTIIRLDDELFSKPVHLKILCDLACDLDVDLSSFAQNPSRWDLYEIFFDDLLERELEKDARVEISGNIRKTFLRELAFWLWIDKAGQVAFSASEIPQMILDELGVTDQDVSEKILREMLVGAFLEKKAGDIFYFGHRSFAEFLVARRLVEVSPVGYEVSTYSRVCTDGVKSFLSDYKEEKPFCDIARLLPQGKGEVVLDFVHFLNSKVGGKAKFLDLIGKEGVAHELVHAVIFDEKEDDEFDNGEDNLFYRLYKGMRSAENSVFFALLHLMVQATKPDIFKTRLFAAKITAAILERLFLGATVDADARKTVVSAQFNEARDLAVRVIGDLNYRADGAYLSISFENLLGEHARVVRDESLRIGLGRPEGEVFLAPEVAVPLADVLHEMWLGGRANTQAHFGRSSSLRDVFTSTKPPRRMRITKPPHP